MIRHQGSCHCGAVRFEVVADDQHPLEPYTCDCSLCSKRGAVMSNVHESRLRILAGEDQLALYQWNARIAKHYFCKVCGVYPFHRKRSMQDHFGVNLACLSGYALPAERPRPAPGRGMPIVDADARPEWPGPREPGSR
ncbi:MAG: GFA family protein [Hyphomonadaceae bacterium]